MPTLINGKIPPNTKCPYLNQCTMSCYHKGIQHEVAFSCGAARAFKMIAEKNHANSQKSFKNNN